jgi:superfamily I DNA and/or RNA helicase
VAELCRERIAEYAGQLHRREAFAIRNARVVLATMTNVYISGLLNKERFDVVIVEEAGMAVLPTLFYCATLADEKIVIVGDPKQLPPIVQSRSRVVHKAMGRSIFEVTVPTPHASDVVVMLDTQYRMHPAIGDLVSSLFYEGKLRNGECTGQREAIAACRPYPGAPIVVVDTEGRTACATRDGSFSRYNEATARGCVGLACEALRDGLESVAIITPYVEQSRLIRRLLREERVPPGSVECRTVHRFQGNERDFVIVDTVDTAPMRPGVLLSSNHPRSAARNLLNVSVSRARGKLLLVADVAYFGREARNSVLNELLSAAIAGGGRYAWGDP